MAERKEKNRYSRPLLELVIITILALVVFVLAIVTEAYERIFYWTQRYEEYEVDEILTVFIILPVAFGVYAYRRWRDYKSVSRKLETANRSLNAAIEEKELLIRETHHRVKNNLALVSALVRAAETGADGVQQLSDMAARIDAIGAMHEQLQASPDQEAIDLGTHLGRIAESVVATAPSAVVINRINEIRVSPKRAVPLGLIVNELATNAVKYGLGSAEEPLFRLESREDDRGWELTISNSGNPFPAELDIEEPETLGLRLVRLLVDQLDGELELQRDPEPRFTIRFPYSETTAATAAGGSGAS
mgnify:CR=1 FL=1